MWAHRTARVSHTPAQSKNDNVDIPDVTVCGKQAAWVVLWQDQVNDQGTAALLNHIKLKQQALHQALDVYLACTGML